MDAKDRKALIRQHFEAYRDLTWAQELEPKFKERGVDAAAMKDFREAWNGHAEVRDWAWWQDEMKNYAITRIQDELMDCVEKLDAIGMLQWQREKAEARFEKLIDQAAERGGKGQTKDQTPER